MTEIDIMRDLDCCSKKACKGCSMCGKVGCSDELAKTAAMVMKMQYDAMKAMSEESKKILEENIQLRKMAKVNCTQKEVVGCVNDIMAELYEDRYEIDVVITECGKLLEKIGARGYVGVYPESFRPEIHLEE